MSQRLSNHIPALKYGAKIYPEDIAGLLGLPYVGNIYYVDGNSGSDSANNGSTPDNAFKTVYAAEDATNEGKHDVVVIVPSGGSGRTAETNAITWDKRFTHLVGSAAPTAQDVRAGMSFGTGGSISFDDNGCLVKGITFNGTTDINVPVTITGHYNSFLGCDFKGSLNGTTGDDAAARALYINGGQENFFGGCMFGADTFARSTTNATLELASSASRNVWEDCRFIMHADNVGPNHVLLTGASAIDRWIEFKNCSFYAFWTNDADKVTHAFDLSAQTATGHVLMTGSQMLVGFDDWEASDSGLMYFEPASATANAIGIAINPSVS